MDWDAIGAVSEALGTLAVVITLIYLEYADPSEFEGHLAQRNFVCSTERARTYWFFTRIEYERDELELAVGGLREAGSHTP